MNLSKQDRCKHEHKTINPTKFGIGDLVDPSAPAISSQERWHAASSLSTRALPLHISDHVMPSIQHPVHRLLCLNYCSVI
jgi:hypothetical protein